MFLGSEELSARIGRCRSGNALLDGTLRFSSSRQRGVGAQSAQGGGGNTRQPGKPSTSSSATKRGLGWMIPTELSSVPSTDRWRQFRSSHFPRPGRRELTPNLSTFFSAEGCIFPFL